GRGGNVYRYVALHPAFPARPRGFLLAYEEIFAGSVRPTSRFADARRVAESLAPRGSALASSLDSANLEARVATFAARIDSSDKLCWWARSRVAPGSAPTSRACPKSRCERRRWPPAPPGSRNRESSPAPNPAARGFRPPAGHPRSGSSDGPSRRRSLRRPGGTREDGRGKRDEGRRSGRRCRRGL